MLKGEVPSRNPIAISPCMEAKLDEILMCCQSCKFPEVLPDSGCRNWARCRWWL